MVSSGGHPVNSSPTACHVTKPSEMAVVISRAWINMWFWRVLCAPSWGEEALADGPGLPFSRITTFILLMILSSKRFKASSCLSLFFMAFGLTAGIPARTGPVWATPDFPVSKVFGLIARLSLDVASEALGPTLRPPLHPFKLAWVVSLPPREVDCCGPPAPCPWLPFFRLLPPIAPFSSPSLELSWLELSLGCGRRRLLWPFCGGSGWLFDLPGCGLSRGGTQTLDKLRWPCPPGGVGVRGERGLSLLSTITLSPTW